jgi:hypothetical protein
MITGGCQALQDTTFLQLVVVPKLSNYRDASQVSGKCG